MSATCRSTEKVSLASIEYTLNLNYRGEALGIFFVSIAGLVSDRDVKDHAIADIARAPRAQLVRVGASFFHQLHCPAAAFDLQYV